MDTHNNQHSSGVPLPDINTSDTRPSLSAPKPVATPQPLLGYLGQFLRRKQAPGNSGVSKPKIRKF